MKTLSVVLCSAVFCSVVDNLRAQVPRVFTASNASKGNAVLVFDRAGNGLVTPAGSVLTGGDGNGGGLGSQGSVTMSDDGHWLFVVNAGSNDLSVFAIQPQGLTLKDVEPALGGQPISVANRGNLVYVANAKPATLTGFTLNAGGTLSAIPGSVQPLSDTDAGPGQVSIGPWGLQVFVTEKNTNQIGIFGINAGGSLGTSTFIQSSGIEPFGFGFGHNDTLIVSEAFGGVSDASAVSSYKVGAASLTPVSASVPTTETAACWIALTRNRRYAYSTNTGSGTVSGFRVTSPSGSLTPLDANGVTADLGSGAMPIDEATVSNRWLYVLSAATSEIAVFRIESDGSLEQIQSVKGLPTSAAGLSAR